MKLSKTTIRELTKRYRAVLIKCALMNLAVFAVAMPAKADVVIGDGASAAYTRVKELGPNRYTIKVNDNAEEFFNYSPDALKMTGGNLIVESKVGYWLDWQGTGGIDISGGTVSAKNEETLSTYRGPLSISGNAVINTAMMSDANTTISGGRITLADTNDANKELYFGKGLGIDAADGQTSGTLSISGGDITLGKNRYIVLLREWGDDDTGSLPAAYHGDIKISGGNITLNKNAQIIRTDNDNNEVGGTLVSNYLKDSRPNELSKTTGEIDISGGTVTLNDTASIVNHSSDGTIRISDAAIINVNGNNRFENAKGIAAADFTGGAINLNGALTANIAATGGTIVFGKETARLNGDLSGSNVDLIFKDNYALSNLNNKATIKKLTIASGKVLDIGEKTLKADEIIGGTIKMVLPSNAVMSAIIQATNASNVLLDVDMSKAGRENAVQYVLTSTDTGYKITNVNDKRYAFSDGAFSLSRYLENPDAYKFDTAWTGGSLYILRLATASEAAVEDLRKEGVDVTEAEENAVAALDMDAQYLSQSAQDNVAKINAMLDDASTSSAQKKQILREVAPEAAPSVAASASSVASNVMNVAGSRMSGGAAQTSRSGGDYTAGQATVWAQGMYNKTKLDKDNGFDADSAGFAAGVEVSVSDSVKIGAGYAYTVTDIDTDRSGTDVDTHTAFLYGEYKPNKAFVNITGSFGHSEYDEKTNLTGLRSEYKADTYGVQAMGGYDFGLITAEAGARYTAVKQKSYTDALGNRMEKSTAETLTGVADVKLAKRFKVNGSKSFITPSVKAGASYDFTADEGNRTIGLADGSSYVAKGERLKRFGVQTGAGVKFDIGEKAQIELSYEGNFKKDYTDHTGLLNIRFNF